MPTFITYERKRLTEKQYHALGAYFARKRLKEGAILNGLSTDIDKQTSPGLNAVASAQASNSPAKPTVREIREGKEQALKDVQKQLGDLESMLSKLKEKKHELFEELKLSLVHSKKHQERERQIQGFPSPFMPHPIGPALINVSPYRPGMKRPKSPSPPLVQLYSSLPNLSNVQPSFPPMANRMPVPQETINPGYQFQQNYLQRDAHQPIQGPQVNPPPNSPRPTGNQFPSHDRNFPPFGSLQMPDHRMNVGHQSPPRPPLAPQPPFMQQNMQQGTANENLPGFSPPGKDRQGFGNPGSRPANYVKRDSHCPSRSRFY